MEKVIYSNEMMLDEQQLDQNLLDHWMYLSENQKQLLKSIGVFPENNDE